MIIEKFFEIYEENKQNTKPVCLILDHPSYNKQRQRFETLSFSHECKVFNCLMRYYNYALLVNVKGPDLLLITLLIMLNSIVLQNILSYSKDCN